MDYNDIIYAFKSARNHVFTLTQCMLLVIKLYCLPSFFRLSTDHAFMDFFDTILFSH